MKKITLLLSLMYFSLGFSQNAPITFEPGAFGNTWTLTGFENGAGVPPSVLANPFPTGLNTSATVCKFTAMQAGQPYAGFETAGIGTFNLTAANCTIKILVYKSVISDVGIKFAAGAASAGEIKVANTLINQWEELTFNFSSQIGQPSSTGINQIVFFPDFNARTGNNICYIDNVRFSAQIPAQAGIVLPVTFENQTPGFYSFTSFGGCDNVVVTNPYQTGGNTSTKVAKNTRNVGSETFAGSYFDITTPINFSTNQTLKMKVWTPNANTPVKMKLEGVGNPNIEVDVVAPLAATWQELTFSFPASVTNSTYKRVVVFFNFGAAGTGEINYFDDVRNGNVLSSEQFNNKSLLKVYPNPTTGIFAIEGSKIIDTLSIYNVLGQEVLKMSPNNTNVSVDISNFNTGVYVVKTSIEGQISTSKVFRN